MKKIILTLMVGAVTCLSRGQYLTNSYSLTPNASIPDGTPIGLTETFSVSGLTTSIVDVQVLLNVSGAYTGDFYAYLSDPSDDISILLNRVGVSSGNPAGYGDAGFNLTLDSSGNNVHNYQSGSYTLSSGQLTGVWAADGRAISPYSTPSSFDTAPTTSSLGIYDGMIQNGTWTLFIADVISDASSPVLNSVTLNVITVPEPGTDAILAVALLLWAVIAMRKGKRTIDSNRV